MSYAEISQLTRYRFSKGTQKKSVWKRQIKILTQFLAELWNTDTAQNFQNKTKAKSRRSHVEKRSAAHQQGVCTIPDTVYVDPLDDVQEVFYKDVVLVTVISIKLPEKEHYDTHILKT